MKQYYSYDTFRKDTNELIVQVKEFQPEAIVGIARGGLTLAHAVAEGLHIREVETIRTELYDETQKREEISLFGRCEFSNITRVLVLDDIADSGVTLQKVMEHLSKNFQDISFASATLFYKKSSCYEPHFWVKEATQWIDFFWERDFLDH